MNTYSIHIMGIVQGVGFRPYVYRLAREHGLSGWVLNAPDGVHIEATGTELQLQKFVEQLPVQAPKAAQIDSINLVDMQAGGDVPATTNSLSGQAQPTPDFEIRESDTVQQPATLISPDLATCPDCLRELFDPADRRYHYPFTNCTNCGPRFTIIESLPYDRTNTTMASFEMCELCAQEYADPDDRRFHAQPDACFECGPQLSLCLLPKAETYLTSALQNSLGGKPDKHNAQIAQVAQLLATGKIVALKSLGGYHLACDATNEQAVQELRQRKHRSAKALAVMVPDITVASELCHLGSLERELLQSPAAPIVLLRRKPSAQVSAKNRIAPSVAGILAELGVMLPYTPLQHLLLAQVDIPLVMTSGNLSEEPIVADIDEAHTELASIADAFLDNDRPIYSRYDDSVVRVLQPYEHTQFVRRARGYAPTPLILPTHSTHTQPAQSILATGSEQKSTFCITRHINAQSGNRQTQAFISQHLGDLENAKTLAAFERTIALYKELFALNPTAIAHDMHPEYLSTKWAIAQAHELDLPLIPVQHHHAHAASVLAENITAGKVCFDERVIALCFDGTGYGTDGAIWGGEVLLATLNAARRFAHLYYVPMPGGAQAIKHPERMAYAHLSEAGLLDHPAAAALLNELGEQQTQLLAQMLKRNLNSPQTSSMGRLFDAVSAILGICKHASYDGQAAIELEAAIYDPQTAELWQDLDESAALRYRFAIEEPTGGCARALNPVPLLKALLDDLESGVAIGIIALRFHRGVVSLAVSIAQCAAVESALETSTPLDTVAISGGVFMNRYLAEQIPPALSTAGFQVLEHINLPANDGCISHGQAAIATNALEDEFLTSGYIL